MRVYTGHHCHITVVYPYMVIYIYTHIRKNISSKNIKSAYKMAIKPSIKCVQEAAPSECISLSCVPTGVHVKGINKFW